MYTNPGLILLTNYDVLELLLLVKPVFIIHNLLDFTKMLAIENIGVIDYTVYLNSVIDYRVYQHSIIDYRVYLQCYRLYSVPTQYYRL